MSYIALYRKFRPLKFSDMVGQEHIAQILKNQITANRIGHAYLFSGGRGTGKTTSAKIFARAVNCLNPQNGEPCNECEICKSIIDGSLTDVTEIDAASNNGVDNIRDIREEVNYAPAKAKYRIYIIDEVHMLSTGAFNALLKTLEEPPKHVKFILATTEPNKLPATILSRCQRFDFKRISNDNIVKKLTEIVENIGKNYEVSALNAIATIADGGMRDAISILERCVTDTNNITLEYVSDLIGIPYGTAVLNIVDKLVDNCVQDILVETDKLLANGQNVNILVSELIVKIRDILVFKATGTVTVINEEEQHMVARISQKVSSDKLVAYISKLSELENSMKWASNPKAIFESGIISLCADNSNDGMDELRKRIEVLEKALESGNFNSGEVKKEIKKTISVVSEEVTENKKEVETEKVVLKEKPQIIEDSGEKFKEWDELLKTLRERGKVALFTNLVNAEAKHINDEVIGIYFKADFAKTMTEKPENIECIKTTINEIAGKLCEIRCFLESEKKTNSKIDEMQEKVKNMNITLNIIDE